MPLLPITARTATPWRARVSSSMPEKPKAPSPRSRTTWRSGRASLAASAYPNPEPRQPNGPGSSQQPGSNESIRRPAYETKSPPSPITIASRSSTRDNSPYTRIGCSGARSSDSSPASAARPSFSAIRRDPIHASRPADDPGDGPAPDADPDDPDDDPDPDEDPDDP